jgi:hypothetical protein
VFERVADERTEEAEDAEGLGRRSGTGNVENIDDALGRGFGAANMSAWIDGAGRGVASSTSGPPELVFGVGFLNRRFGVWCIVSLISPQPRFRPVRFRGGSEGSGRFLIQCMMWSGSSMIPP